MTTILIIQGVISIILLIMGIITFITTVTRYAKDTDSVLFPTLFILIGAIGLFLCIVL